VGCGGCTRFLVDDLQLFQDAKGRFTVEDPKLAVKHCVRPQMGAAVAFYHGQMHDGEPLNEEAPPKWIFRFDVLYMRETPVDEKAESLRRIEVEAEGIEREQPIVSMQLYRLAERLREGLIPLPSAQVQAAALLGRATLLEGDVDTDTWKPEEMDEVGMGGDTWTSKKRVQAQQKSFRENEPSGLLPDSDHEQFVPRARPCLSIRATGGSSALSKLLVS
jgi:hypothetical protein